MTTDDEVEARLRKLLSQDDFDSNIKDKLSKMDSSDLAKLLPVLERLPEIGRQIPTTPLVEVEESLARERNQRRTELIEQMQGAMNALASHDARTKKRLSNMPTARVELLNPDVKPTSAKLMRLRDLHLPKKSKKGRSRRDVFYSNKSRNVKSDLVIQLARGGLIGRPMYDVIVKESKERRDGRFIEKIGVYNPSGAHHEGALFIAMDRVTYWLGAGARSSETVEQLISVHTDIENQLPK